MHIDLSFINTDPKINVDTNKFNDRVASIEDAAYITEGLESLQSAIDRYTQLNALYNLYTAKKVNKTAVAAVEALLPSEERITIFTIGKVILKGIWSICSWVLRSLGRIWKFFFGFTKRSIKDADKDLQQFGNKLPHMQSEVVAPAVSFNEVKQWYEIIKSHAANTTVTPNVQEGTTVTAYKAQFYNAFNAQVIGPAKVTNNGAIQVKPQRRSGSAKLSDLGWSTQDVYSTALGNITECENECEAILKDLRKQGGDVAKVAKACEAQISRGAADVSNSIIQEKASTCIDCACVVTIIGKDIINLKTLENSFGKLTSNLRNIAKKYAD